MFTGCWFWKEIKKAKGEKAVSQLFCTCSDLGLLLVHGFLSHQIKVKDSCNIILLHGTRVSLTNQEDFHQAREEAEQKQAYEPVNRTAETGASSSCPTNRATGIRGNEDEDPPSIRRTLILTSERGAVS